MPFLTSIMLVAISLWICISLRDSPLFARLKKTGAISKNPIKESFGNPYNLNSEL